MGLTPSGGVIMGARSGDLDPGVLAYLMRAKKFDAAGLEDLVNHRSGLLGISGISSDMRHLHQVASSQADARLAISMFCSSVAKQVASMITVLEGVDMIVFTGGIGENDGAARAAICGRLAWMGIKLDDARNGSASDAISDTASRCLVRVLPPREEEQIACHTWELLSNTVRS
jgi:acetate kinase